MKRARKVKEVVKGAPSSFVISLAVHAVAFLLAGMRVVFNVVKKEEKKFIPPKAVERPNWFFILADNYISHSGPTGNYYFQGINARIQDYETIIQ